MRRSRIDTFTTSNNELRCQAKINHTFSTEQYIKGAHSLRFFTEQDTFSDDDDNYYNESVGVVPSTNRRVANMEPRYENGAVVEEDFQIQDTFTLNKTISSLKIILSAYVYIMWLN